MSSHEEYLTLHERAAVVDRNHRGRLRLTGADRRSYLQGLLTNDIEALAPGTGCYAALLTAQGRMIADMRVLETGDEILMDLAGGLAGRVHDHLSNFIFSEDVNVETVTASTRQWGVYGPDSPAVLAKTLARQSPGGGPAAAELEALPTHDNRRWKFQDRALLVVRSDQIGVRGFDLFIESTHAAALVQALIESGGVHVGPEAVEIARIEAGRPLFGVDMDEDTIPLEAGIEDRAISMTKGCYVGQEIIVRVLHRGGGRVARRLVGLELEASSAIPGAGTALNSGDREVGRITSAVHSPRMGPIALGYVHRDFAAPGTRVSVGEHDAKVVALPFVRESNQPRPLSR